MQVGDREVGAAPVQPIEWWVVLYPIEWWVVNSIRTLCCQFFFSSTSIPLSCKSVRYKEEGRRPDSQKTKKLHVSSYPHMYK